jgi:acetylornithine/succinyldiaminopimelate/putrescine aminotransferase
MTATIKSFSIGKPGSGKTYSPEKELKEKEEKAAKQLRSYLQMILSKDLDNCELMKEIRGMGILCGCLCLEGEPNYKTLNEMTYWRLVNNLQ